MSRIERWIRARVRLDAPDVLNGMRRFALDEVYSAGDPIAALFGNALPRP